MSDPFNNPGQAGNNPGQAGNNPGQPGNGSGQPAPPPWQPGGPSVPPTFPGQFAPPGQQWYLPPTQPVYNPTGGTPNYDTTINTVLAPGAQPPRRSRGKMIGALVGVIAILGAGTFAFTQLRSNDSSGGASKPEEVGNKLVTALGNEDVLGAIDLLLPGERDTFRQPMIDLV